MSNYQWWISSCGACRLSKIHGPLVVFPGLKPDSVKSRGMNKKKHKTVFGDFKGISIHERRKVAVVQLNFLGSHFITLSFSTGLSKARACRL